MNRRLAALLSVYRGSTTDFAGEAGTSRTYLADICAGRAIPGDDIEERLKKGHGAAPEWLTTGDGPVFSKSPGRDIERAVELQLELGTAGMAPVPAYESISDVKLGVKEREAEERRSPKWKTHAIRGIAPVTAAAGSGFYIRASDPGVAKAIGCATGDYILCVTAREAMRGTRFSVGDVLPCLVSAGRARTILRLRLVHIDTAHSKKHGLGFAAPERTRDLALRGAYGNEYSFKVHGGRRPEGTLKLIAIAMRAEKDLWTRSEDI